MATKVLFVGEGVTLAHISRPLTLAKSLDPRRYDVCFACGGRWSSFVEDAGFSPHSIPTRSSEEFVRDLAHGRPLFSAALLETYATAELKLLTSVAPDIVVGDFRISLGVSTEVAKIPYVALANAYWSPYSTLPFPTPEHPAIDLVGLPFARAILPLVRPVIFRRHIRDFNWLRRKYGLQPVRGLREMYTRGTWTLYLDVPSLAPTRDLPESHRYVGPVLWEPDVPLPPWWNAMTTHRPIVYVTLGSSGDQRVLTPLLGALDGLGSSVALAMAGQSIGKLPTNVFTADYLPALKILEHAALVVCNGGSPTAYQALSRGVPVLGLPSNADQYLMMESVVRQGAGMLVRSGRATVLNIRSAIERLLSDSAFQRAASRLRDEIHHFDATREFAAFFQRVTETAHSPLRDDIPPAQ